MKRREVVFMLAVFGFSAGLFFKLSEPKRLEKQRLGCYSNIRQIGLAIQQYAYDYDQTLPHTSFKNPNSTEHYTWLDAVFPYVKNTEAFTCPTDGVNQPYQPHSKNYGSYVMNNAYYLSGDAQTPPSGIRLDRIQSPYSTVLLTDGQNDFQFSWPNAQETPTLVSQEPAMLDSIVGRHPTNRQWTIAAGADGSCSTALLGFATRTKIIKGQTVYTNLTVQDD